MCHKTSRLHLKGMRKLKFYIQTGADISRTVMSHLDRTIYDDRRLLEFAKRGCYLEYDMFGIECSHYQVGGAGGRSWWAELVGGAGGQSWWAELVGGAGGWSWWAELVGGAGGWSWRCCLSCFNLMTYTYIHTHKIYIM